MKEGSGGERKGSDKLDGRRMVTLQRKDGENQEGRSLAAALRAPLTQAATQRKPRSLAFLGSNWGGPSLDQITWAARYDIFQAATPHPVKQETYTEAESVRAGPSILPSPMCSRVVHALLPKEKVDVGKTKDGNQIVRSLSREGARG